MKRNFKILVFALICSASLGASAQAPAPADKPAAKSAGTVTLPAGVTEDMLAPPPVPRFMMEKQDKPLSMDEMVRQAREAEQKAGAKPVANAKPDDKTATDKK